MHSLICFQPLSHIHRRPSRDVVKNGRGEKLQHKFLLTGKFDQSAANEEEQTEW
jgi:hypothetical protein